jgi:hypothetical protein
MQKRYGVDEMIRVFSPYMQFARHMQEANLIISGSRETRHLRATEYKRLEADYITRLIDTYHQLSFSEQLALSASKKRKIRTRAISTVAAGKTSGGRW